MKLFFSIVTSLFVSISYAGGITSTGDEGPAKAIHIVIEGKGPAVDSEAYLKVRTLIGQSIVDQVVDKFIVHSYGDEGGFSACVQKAPFAEWEALATLYKKFESIKPNPETTFYQIAEASRCKDMKN